MTEQQPTQLQPKPIQTPPAAAKPQIVQQPPGKPSAPKEPLEKQAEEMVGGGGGLGKVFGILTVLILVVVVLFGGGAVLAAMTNYKIIPVPQNFRGQVDDVVALLPLPKSPEFLLRVGSRRMIQKGSFKAELEIEAKSGEMQVKLGGSMPVIVEKGQPKTEVSFSAETVGPEVMKIKGDLKMIGEKFYFRLEELPEIPFFDLSAFKGKWFYTVAESKKAETEKVEVDKELEQKLTKVFGEFLGKLKFSEEGGESCGGVACRKIVVSVGKEEMKWFVVEIQKVMDKTKELASEKEAQIEKGLENIEWPLKAIFLVGKGDLLIYEALFAISAKVENQLPQMGQGTMSSGMPAGMLGGLGDKLTLSIKVKFSEFGKKFDVLEPAGAQDIKTLKFEEMFSVEKMMKEQTKEGTGSGAMPGLPEGTSIEEMFGGGTEGLPPQLLKEIEEIKKQQEATQ